MKFTMLMEAKLAKVPHQSPGSISGKAYMAKPADVAH